MIGTERQKEIMEYLNKYETVSVKKIVETFYVSEATARRDLNALEQSGQVRRVFGGATINVSPDNQIPLFVRDSEDEKEKAELCRKASELIADGNVIFIDGSSTVKFIVPYLKKFKDLVVITNGMKIAEALNESDVKVYLTGGLLIKNSFSFAGNEAERFAKYFNADICFISCKGLSDDGILSDTSYEETQLRKIFVKNSARKVALITKSKIGKKYIHTLCSADVMDKIITVK